MYTLISTLLWPLIDIKIVILLNMVRKVTHLFPAVVGYHAVFAVLFIKDLWHIYKLLGAFFQFSLLHNQSKKSVAFKMYENTMHALKKKKKKKLSGEATCQTVLHPFKKKRSTLNGKNLLLLEANSFPFRVGSFSERGWCAGKRTQSPYNVTSWKHAYIMLNPLNPTFI